MKGKAALQQCIEEMKGFVISVVSSIDLVVQQLQDYKISVIQTLKYEVLQAETDLEAALQEVDRCLRGGAPPQHPLATWLLTQTHAKLQLFTYILTPPDVKHLMMKWVHYTNNFPVLCGRESPRQVYELTFAKIAGIWWPGVVLDRKGTKKKVRLINKQTEALWIVGADLLDYTSASASHGEELVKALELARYASAGRLSNDQLFSPVQSSSD